MVGHDLLQIEKRGNFLYIDNPKNVSYQISVSVESKAKTQRMIAGIRFNPKLQLIEVNDNWLVGEKYIRNQVLDKDHRQSLIVQSQFINIELSQENFDDNINNRVDIQLMNGGPMSLCLSQYELLDVCNGEKVFSLTQKFFNDIARREYPQWFEKHTAVDDDNTE